MKAFVLFSSLAIFAQSTFCAAAPAPENLPAAIQRQVAEQEALQKKSAEGMAALHQWYDSALDAVKKDAVSKGDLDRVVGVDIERTRMDRDLTAEEREKLAPLLRDVRIRYDQARAQRKLQDKEAMSASLRDYLGTLEVLEKTLTQKLDIDGALAVRQERVATAAQSSAPPVVAAAPPPSAPAPPAAAPASVVAPDLARTLSPVLQVGAELKAWGRLRSPAPEAISFECPNADAPGRGGRGVFLKNSPSTGLNGSTWTADYTRTGAAFGLQFLHPHGSGQVVVSVRQNGLFIDTPKAWLDGGWNGAAHKHMLMTKEGAAFFPLHDGEKYELVSKLSASGNYVITINGKVAGTAQVSGAHALDFPEVATAVPKKWSAGFAALLVGPVDKATNGANICEHMTFQADAL